jgi:Zn-dependent peptidase ImmA (M78 family)
MRRARFWTNKSVATLAAGKDPIAAIARAAQSLVLEGHESGWSGPPFDPIRLAELRGINVDPDIGILEAKIAPAPGNKLRIQYNPNRPENRIRYSIAHELAHSLFPDCADEVRHRSFHSDFRNDAWQLEMLCNLGAAEILMPIGSLQGEATSLIPSIDLVRVLKTKFQVSTEAMLLRIAKLSEAPALAFAAHLNLSTNRYEVDYCVGSLSSGAAVQSGQQLPKSTVAGQVTAIGFTAKGVESWSHLGEVQVECIGTPPYPGQVFPRVLGFAKPTDYSLINTARVEHLVGDATQPRGGERKLILQIVNDKTPRWGAGFALAVRKKWPHVQNDFIKWAEKHHLKLGEVHVAPAEADIDVVSMIAQHGYGPSAHARIRYGALRHAFDRIVDLARAQRASIHMPRLGSGQSGGSWWIVSELIRETLISNSLRVTVYDLPNSQAPFSMSAQYTLEMF